MGNIFTRKALNEIMGNEALTPEITEPESDGSRLLDAGYYVGTPEWEAAVQVCENLYADRSGIWSVCFGDDERQSDFDASVAAVRAAYLDEYGNILGVSDVDAPLRQPHAGAAVRQRLFDVVYQHLQKIGPVQPLKVHLAKAHQKHFSHLESP